MRPKIFADIFKRNHASIVKKKAEKAKILPPHKKSLTLELENLPTMICNVIQKGESTLRKTCEPVTNFDAIQETIKNLKDTMEQLKGMHSFKRDIELAAPQIGELKQVAVIEYNQEKMVLINPTVIKNSINKRLIREGCISFFKYRALVPRYESVAVKAQNEKGETLQIKSKSDLAMLLQHEIDHLHGVLYIDHLQNGESDMWINQ